MGRKSRDGLKMNTWMKGVLALLGIMLVVAIVALATQRAVSIETYRFPFPGIDRWELEFTCIDDHGGIPAERNAENAYRAYVQHIQRGINTQRPSINEFSQRAGDALASAEALLADIQREQGCTIDVVR